MFVLESTSLWSKEASLKYSLRVSAMSITIALSNYRKYNSTIEYNWLIVNFLLCTSQVDFPARFARRAGRMTLKRRRSPNCDSIPSGNGISVHLMDERTDQSYALSDEKSWGNAGRSECLDEGVTTPPEDKDARSRAVPLLVQRYEQCVS